MNPDVGKMVLSILLVDMMLYMEMVELIRSLLKCHHGRHGYHSSYESMLFHNFPQWYHLFSD
jgi:hypothetical protein